jgi:hypothetical protein
LHGLKGIKEDELLPDGATDEGATKIRVKLRRPPQGLPFWVGVMLIGLSFGIYPSYPVVFFLPISAWRKGEVAIGLLAVSWGMFFVGSALVGKKSVAYLKRRFFKRREHQRSHDRT